MMIQFKYKRFGTKSEPLARRSSKPTMVERQDCKANPIWAVYPYIYRAGGAPEAIKYRIAAK
jgi:hypothetical protein